MAEEKETPETPEEVPDDAPSQAARDSLKGIVKEALAEHIEENKPSPQRTKKPQNFLNQLLGM